MNELEKYIGENETLVRWSGIAYVVKAFTPHDTATVFRLYGDGSRTRVFYSVAQQVAAKARQ